MPSGERARSKLNLRTGGNITANRSYRLSCCRIFDHTVFIGSSIAVIGKSCIYISQTIHFYIEITDIDTGGVRITPKVLTRVVQVLLAYL